ncbi:MAG: T9SS type A sorting domain-containing protein [Bacteroidota bacterium]
MKIHSCFSWNGKIVAPFILTLLFCFLGYAASAQIIIIDVEIPLVGNSQTSNFGGMSTSLNRRYQSNSLTSGPSFQVSPNPIIDHMTIRSYVPVIVYRISIFDLSGNEIVSVPVGLGGTQVQIQSVDPGMYSLKIESSLGVHVENILVAE